MIKDCSVYFIFLTSTPKRNTIKKKKGQKNMHIEGEHDLKSRSNFKKKLIFLFGGCLSPNRRGAIRCFSSLPFVF